MFDKLNESIKNVIIAELERIKNLPADKIIGVTNSKSGKHTIKYLNEKDELCVITITFQGELTETSAVVKKLTPLARRERVKTYRVGGMSQAQISTLLNVSQKTISNDIKVINSK